MNSDFSDNFPLRKTRTHEVCGPGALMFSFALGGHIGGSVLWIHEAWQGIQINPTGFATYIDPKNLIFAQAKNQTEVLAVAEEALRAGVLPLVVMELNAPLSLTAGRRLQLAAEAGAATGLCIIPEDLGSNTAETRWHCAPVFDAKDSTLQRWELKKNKAGTLGAWDVRWNAETRRIIVVSEAAQRQGSARTSG